MRRGALAVGLGLVVALLGSSALLARKSAEPAVATPAPQLRTAPTVHKEPVLADARVAASAPLAASHIPAWSSRALRMREDWCRFGLKAHRHDLDALEANKARRPESQFVDLKDHTAERNLEGSRLIAAAADAARERWVRALRARGDVRSLAVADFLQGWDPDAPATAAPRASLQALARQSTDPFVTFLALQRPCVAGGCRNVDAAQWSRLEPSNVEAWLKLMDGTADAAVRPDLRNYVWNQLVAQARYSHNYLPDLLRFVREVVSPTAGGIELYGEYAAFVQLAGSWDLPSIRTVTDRCLAGRRAHEGPASDCLKVAEAMWHGGHFLSRSIAERVAEVALADAGSSSKQWSKQWSKRSLELQAMKAYLHSKHREEDIERVFAAASGGAACGDTRTELGRVTDPQRLDEWERMQLDLQAAGGSLEDWAAKRPR